MKKILPALLIVFSNSIFSQTKETEMTRILDTVILRSKEISLYSNTVNWDSLSTKMYASAKNAKNIEALKPAFKILINSLRDAHGNIRSTADYSILASFTDYKNSRKTDSRTRNPEIWKIVNNVESRFEYETLPGNIAYLKVVGIGPNVDGQQESERIRKALAEMADKKVEKWILDLRYNGGGNINVMMAGLAPLFDIEEVAGIRDEQGKIQGLAEVKNGNFWYYGVNAFTMTEAPKIHKPKIAILLSRWTVSSGELLAVALKGQYKTRFFGENTGGLTTNNSWEVIANKVALNISTGVYSDRNGKSYDQFVEADQEILFKVETDKEKDQGILAALNWLNDK